MKELESAFEESRARMIFKKVLNHSVNMNDEWIQELRKSRTETAHKTIFLGHVDGSFTFYYEGKMYIFDCHPASNLYEIRTIVNGNCTVSINTDISSTKLLERPR